jgi:hypothetical protein
MAFAKKDKAQTVRECEALITRKVLGNNTTINFPSSYERVSGSPWCVNPGNVADLHKLCLNVVGPEWFEGFAIGLTQYCGSNKKIFGSWTLSHVLPTGFRCGALYQSKVSNSVLVNMLPSPENFAEQSVNGNLHVAENANICVRHKSNVIVIHFRAGVQPVAETEAVRSHPIGPVWWKTRKQ